MCKKGRKTACAPAKPERICYRRLFYTLAFLHFWSAHRLGKGRHIDRKFGRSCIDSQKGPRPSVTLRSAEIECSCELGAC